jgi:hypothetical protein
VTHWKSRDRQGAEKTSPLPSRSRLFKIKKTVVAATAGGWYIYISPADGQGADGNEVRTMKARPRTKAAKKRRIRLKEERRKRKKHPHFERMGGRV